MGHLINPISTRLSYSAYWLSSWTERHLRSFSYGLMLDYGVAALIEWAFIYSWFAQLLTKNGIFVSHYRIVRRGKKIRVHAFLIYNSSKFLKSSFVEVLNEPLEAEWGGSWSEDHLNEKIKSLSFRTVAAAAEKIVNANLTSKKKLRTLVLAKRRLNGINQPKILNGRLSPYRFFETKFIKRFHKRLYQIKMLKTLSFANRYFSSILSSILSHFFSKVAVFKNGALSIGFRFVSQFKIVNPQFLARFVARRVSYGFPLARVVRPLLKDLNEAIASNLHTITGFRIACSGRFNRKQMATYVWEKAGSLPLNSMASQISYGFATAFLKYGACGIKIWVASSDRGFRSQIARQQQLDFPPLTPFIKGSINNKQNSAFLDLLKASSIFTTFSNAVEQGIEVDALNLNVPSCTNYLNDSGEECAELFEELANEWVMLENLYLSEKRLARKSIKQSSVGWPIKRSNSKVSETGLATKLGTSTKQTGASTTERKVIKKKYKIRPLTDEEAIWRRPKSTTPAEK